MEHDLAESLVGRHAPMGLRGFYERKHGIDNRAKCGRVAVRGPAKTRQNPARQRLVEGDPFFEGARTEDRSEDP
jgi:hypothetical protein